MRIVAVVKPGSGKPGIEKQDDGTYVVKVREPAREGLANKAVIEALSRELNCPKSRIQLIRGEGSRTKIFEVG